MPQVAQTRAFHRLRRALPRQHAPHRRRYVHYVDVTTSPRVFNHPISLNSTIHRLSTKLKLNLKRWSPLNYVTFKRYRQCSIATLVGTLRFFVWTVFCYCQCVRAWCCCQRVNCPPLSLHGIQTTRRFRRLKRDLGKTHCLVRAFIWAQAGHMNSYELRALMSPRFTGRFFPADSLEAWVFSALSREKKVFFYFCSYQNVLKQANWN